MSLVGTKNQSFTIIEQGKKAVLAYSEIKLEWVAWSYRIENDKGSYFWGRYCSSYEAAKEKFTMKENGEYSG